MPRRKRMRRVLFSTDISHYKPAGIPLKNLENVIIETDELEAIRLADLEGMYHEEAARAMDVSRQTFGRIIASARQKIADALVNAKAIQMKKES